jgi:hypothetical protein
MKKTSKEYTEHILRRMTVDMFIDLWQTKECALASIEESLDVLEDFKDHPAYEEKRSTLEEARENLNKKK